MTVPQRREFPHGTIELFEEGYICHTILTSLSPEDAQESMDTINEFVPPGRRLYLIVDLKYRGNLPRNTRRVFERTRREDLAIAFVMRSKITELIINFWFRFSTSTYTSRMFSNPEDALRWMMLQLEQDAQK